MFFTTTIITTIGYGNIAPTTTAGRWEVGIVMVNNEDTCIMFRAFCIVFAIIGIPLTLSVLADLAAALATVISRLCNYIKSFRPVLIKYRLISHTPGDDGKGLEIPQHTKVG